MNLDTDFRRHKRFIKNTGDRVKISTDFTNQRFKYLNKERLKKAQLTGFGKSKSINLKSLKMDLKKV